MTITILHTNDIHGRHAPFEAAPGDATSQTGDPGRSPAQFDHAGMVGGFQYLAGKVGEIRKREGEDKVLLLEAGDRKRVVEGKSGSVRVALGGRRIRKKKKTTEIAQKHT